MNKIDKKKFIINAAVELMRVKGKNATIAEIAELAGVNESIIYHYFKNKMDLLYYATGEVLRKRTRELEEHLQGIKEPVSRLSKLIWVQLSYQEIRSKYLAFAIFECRVEKGFSHHAVVRHFNRWINIMDSILEEGIKDRSFSRDLNIPTAREMIFGLLEMENIQVLTGQRIENINTDFNDIMALILPMLTEKKDRGRGPKEKREIIIEAAESVFSEKGYDRATTLEVAKAANVSEGALYGYFENKEDILFSGIQHRLKDHLNLLEDLFEIRSPVRKLHRFIEHHFIMYLRQPLFLRTFISEGIYNRRFYQSDGFKDLKRYLEMIDLILEEGKEEGFFRPEINPRVFKNLFLGAFCRMVLSRYYPSGDPNQDMMGRMNGVISMLMKTAILPKVH